MPSYFKFKLLGEGTYAVVYLAKEAPFEGSKIIKRDPGKGRPYVAVKKIKKSQYSTGMEISAIREMRMLKELKHEYIVHMSDLFIHKGGIHMVLEYVEHDLEKVIRCKELVLVPSNIKGWMAMLMQALAVCHQRGVIHRDIKPSNLLVTGSGVLKLADFGIARRLGNEMTRQAVTRWYRAPEVLLGAQSYGPPVDMWAAGAVLAELLLRVPMFAAETDIEQLDLIFRALGTPTAEDWPGMKDLPGYCEFQPRPRPNLSQIMSGASSDVLGILQGLLTYDPLQRLTALDALKHSWFSNAPLPSKPGEFPLPKM
ncbi:cyclin-dependent kinase 7 [Pancytospora philotis]|nr:cyclin-dependent kinase 7 [Pancytospora philotis]